MKNPWTICTALSQALKRGSSFSPSLTSWGHAGFVRRVYMCFVNLGKTLNYVPQGVLWGTLVGGYCYMAFGLLCDPCDCFVGILAIRSSVFSASVGLPQDWPQLDTGRFKKKRLLPSRQKGNRTGSLVQWSLWIGWCRRSFMTPGTYLRKEFIYSKWTGMMLLNKSKWTEEHRHQMITRMKGNQRGSDIQSGWSCLQLCPRVTPLTHWEDCVFYTAKGRQDVSQEQGCCNMLLARSHFKH